MKLTYTPILDKNTPCPCYYITFEIVHGDYDTHYSQTVTFTEVAKIEEYITVAKHISSLIDQQRSGNSRVRKEIQHELDTCRFDIPYDYDSIYEGAGVFAATGISKIVYVDPVGAKFEVTVTDE